MHARIFNTHGKFCIHLSCTGSTYSYNKGIFPKKNHCSMSHLRRAEIHVRNAAAGSTAVTKVTNGHFPGEHFLCVWS